ncbi:MAG: 3'(2'),5'-bisphosphate nucleotidase CysQ [Paracoccaceae bacterium]
MGASPAEDRDLLIEAGLAAGEIALERFRGRFDVSEKPGGLGPVTDADLAVDRRLRERLGAARPDYGWLSEETDDDPARLDAERVFVVDPIDGTRAFIAGEKGWGVALAVVSAGRVTAATVVLPARGEVYAAALGQGATLDGAALAPGDGAGLPGASVLAARPAFEARHWRLGVPEVARSFRTALAWRLCLAASGRFDAVVTLRGSFEWDVAAGALIAAEAGLAVTDARGGALSFNRAEPRLDGVIAAPPSLHAALMARRGLGPRL